MNPIQQVTYVPVLTVFNPAKLYMIVYNNLEIPRQSVKAHSH